MRNAFLAGTIVTNVSSPHGKAIHEVPLPAEAESEDDTPVRIPPSLKISEVSLSWDRQYFLIETLQMTTNQCSGSEPFWSDPDLIKSSGSGPKIS